MLRWISIFALVVSAQGQPPGRCQPANVIDCPEVFYAAPSTASQREKAAVSRAIQDALDARFKRVEEEMDLALLAVYLKKPSLDPDKRTPDELATAIVKGGHARKAAEDAEYKQFNAAIALALPAYNLTPPQTSIPDSPRGKETAAWKPRFSRLEKFDETKNRWRARDDQEIIDESADAARTSANAGGNKVEFAAFAAQTWTDGRISMHWLAFVRNTGSIQNPKYVPDPDVLAGLIAHETVHWVRGQVPTASTSRTQIFDAYAAEAAANEAQAELLKKQGHASASDYFAYSAQYAEQARQVTGMSADVTWDKIKEKHPDWLPVGGHGAALRPGVPAPVEPGEVDGLEWAREHSGITFTESLGPLGDLAAEARRAANAHTAGREAHRERERQARLGRLAQEEARQSEVWEYLVATTKLACTDPDALEEQVRLKRVVGADANSLYLMDRLAQTQAAGWGNVGKGLSACQETLVNSLLRSRQPVAVYDLLAWARDYRSGNPSLGENISGALHEFFDAVGRVSPPNPGTPPSETAPPPQSESPRREPDQGAAETTRPPRERDAMQDTTRGGIHVPPCREEAGGWRCIRW